MNRLYGGMVLGSVLVLLVLASSVVGAHKYTPRREVLLQWDEKGGVAVLRYTTAGKSGGLLWATYDLNHNGRFDQGEGKLVSAVLLQRALRGLELLDGEISQPWKLEEGAVDFVVPGTHKFGVRGLVQWPAPEGSAVLKKRLTIKVTRGYEPLTLQMQALHPWQVVATTRGTLSQDRHGLAGKLHLHAGEEVTLTLAMAQDNQREK